jgi:hypothetical protein
MFGGASGANASTAVKFGDISTGRRLGEAGVEAVSDGKFGDVDVVVSDEVKFGDVDTDGKFGEVDDASVDGTKFGELAAGDVDTRFDDIGAVAVTAGKFGDIDFVGMRGRKFGDMAKESVRFGAESEIARRAGRSGDVDVDVSCADILGQTSSALFST